MNQSGNLDLISVSNANDKYGVSQPSETSRGVFCRVKSVSASEFARVGLSGLKPAWRFTVNADEYCGETLVRYLGKKYAVYRTYQPSQDKIELYVEVKTGV